MNSSRNYKLSGNITLSILEQSDVHQSFNHNEFKITRAKAIEIPDDLYMRIQDVILEGLQKQNQPAAENSGLAVQDVSGKHQEALASYAEKSNDANLGENQDNGTSSQMAE